MERITILYADTGGGHRSAAEAVAQGIHQVYPHRFELAFANRFSSFPFPFSLAESAYPPFVNYGRPLYAAAFHATNQPVVTEAIRRLFEQLTTKLARDMIEEYAADLYICVHPFYTQIMPRAIRDSGVQAKVVTVVSDLVSGHTSWYFPEVDRCIVPTEHAREQALHAGMAEHKLRVCGQPVWPDFAKRALRRTETRASLGLTADLPVVLMMGGGEGMGNMAMVAREIAFSDLPIQFVVVCGRNAALRKELEFVNPRVPAMRVLGFVRNVPELMGASDILVSKAGPGTISEAFIARLPIILYDALPGQEEGNVDYVVEQGAGVFRFLPWTVVQQLRKWLISPQQLEAVRSASARLGRPYAALDIARAAVGVLDG